MLRYTIQLFGITVFALAMIWFAGPGEAQQIAANKEPVIWADTVHINLNEANQPTSETPKQTGDSFLRAVKSLNQAMFSIRNSYMEDVDVDKIVKAGIRHALRLGSIFGPDGENIVRSTHGVDPRKIRGARPADRQPRQPHCRHLSH